MRAQRGRGTASGPAGSDRPGSASAIARRVAADGSPHVRAEALTKRFGSRAAVDDVTFEFEEPFIVGLVGPNGAGKTTLIRLLLGLTKPSAGRVEVDGLPAKKLHTRGHRLVGYMPQTEALYPDLTARQNVNFFAKVHRVPRGRRTQAVDDALRLVDLFDRADDRLAQLSGGMRRRVSLAASLVHSPDLVVLDEPTVGVDPDLRLEMWRTFRKLRDQGALIFLSTHYLGEADRCDVVVFMRGGKILAGDTPARLLERTGTDDLEDAFLRLLGKGGEAA